MKLIKCSLVFKYSSCIAMHRAFLRVVVFHILSHSLDTSDISFTFLDFMAIFAHTCGWEWVMRVLETLLNRADKAQHTRMLRMIES